MMKILSFTSLYPNASQINHGIFVENRLRHLVASGEVDLEIIAPVPWFPFQNERFGKYAAFAKVPKSEVRNGLTVSHPRYPVIPRYGMTIAPRLMYRALLGKVRQHVKQRGGIDLIDAHYYYPDGVAAVNIGQRLGIPVVVTARGTDINDIPGYPRARQQILDTAKHAAASITVSQSLKDAMINIGCEAEKINVLRNGVDLEMFHPGNHQTLRKSYVRDASHPLILSVGSLIDRKGHHLIIEALNELPEAHLVIAGEGEFHFKLTALISKLGLQERVRLVGRIPHDQLPDLYAAADVLVLASQSEGWPNVLLEAMACGTPAAATPVGGIGDIITNPAAGRLIPERSSEAIAATLNELLSNLPDRRKTRAHAETYSWEQTTQGQLDLFRWIIDEQSAP